LVKSFWEYSKAGRELAELHLNYENLLPPDFIKVDITSENYVVEKLRHPQKGQRDTINYNSNIKITNIPEDAYRYVVNGKSPIEWIMERYQVKTDEKSNILNNPNLWCKENSDPKYIYNLLLSVITLSISTSKIVSELPDITTELS